MLKGLFILALLPTALPAVNILGPGDLIFGVRKQGSDIQVGVALNSPGPNNWPAAESPGHVIDGVGQKYLNFGKLNTGFAVTPNSSSVVTSMQLWTANDQESRDPASYELYGTTAPLTFTGMNVSQFMLISSGPLALPASRNAGGDAVLDDAKSQTLSFANATPYSSYLVLFPTVKNEASANSMQISEVQLMGTGFVRVPERHTVSSLADSGAGSLRDTIVIAYSGDMILFAPWIRGKLTLTSGELWVGKPLTIAGPGASLLAISGNNGSRVLHIGPQGNVELQGLTITEGRTNGINGNGPQANGTPAFGGGILNEGTLRLFDCMLTTNRAQGGRGGDGEAGGFRIIPGNGAIARGGGIYNLGFLEMVRCTLLGNTAQGGRGGDAGFNELALAADGGWGDSGEGGAIWDNDRGVRLENCTIFGNQAMGGGGGAPFGSGALGGAGSGAGGALSGSFDLESCTITRNSAVGGAGINAAASAGGARGQERVCFILNSIIAQNTVSGQFTSSPDVADPGASASWQSRGWNFIGATNGSGGWGAGDLTGNSAAPLNPLLGPCQDNGGPVWTVCPLPNSPVRDNGSSTLASDARRGPRRVDFPTIPNAPGGDGSDIGAVKVDSLLEFVSVGKMGTVASVRFKSDPGNLYVLQHTSVVTNRTWTNVVGTGRTGTGVPIDVTDNVANASRRFYRMLSEPQPPLPPPVASGPGSALQLDGDDDYAVVPDSPDLRLGNQFTIEFWFKPASLNQGANYLLARSAPDTSRQTAVIFGYSAPNQVEFYCLGHSGANPRPDSTLTLLDTGWHHIAYSYDGMTWSGYLDGGQIFSTNRVFSPSTLANDWYVGTAFATDPARVAGSFDEIRLWNLRRSTTQIQQARARRLLGNETGLVGYWRFDEGAGAMAADATGNAAHTASLRNGPVWISSALAPFAPNAATLPATGITGTSATLNGVAQPNGAATTGYFEWGLTPGFGNVTPLSSLGSGAASVQWNRVLTGLTPGTNCFYRAVVTNAHGASFGEALSFR